jgi:acylphosphatase
VATYKLNRNYLLHTKTGNTIYFKKGEPTVVPKHCVKEVVAIGAELLEGEVVDTLEDEVEVVVLSPEERVAKLKDAFRVMEGRTERNDFTGNGQPNVHALEKLVGFEVDSKERTKVWEDYLLEKEAD